MFLMGSSYWQRSGKDSANIRRLSSFLACLLMLSSVGAENFSSCNFLAHAIKINLLNYRLEKASR